MQIPVRRWSSVPAEEKARLLARSESGVDQLEKTAHEISSDVRARGDEAIREYNHRFDGTPKELPLAVTASEIEAAIASLDPKVTAAIDYAVSNVTRVHERQLPSNLEMEEVRPGIVAGERTAAVESVGLYVPRSRGSFPSMLYMLAVPAKLAGVPHLALCTPGDRDGTVDAACLYAAKRCGIDVVYRASGIQAISAYAFGTNEIKAVRKIVGPGSAYVAAAKRILRDIVDVGLPAGPSESMILADETADPRTLTLDLLIEAEHGEDSQAILVTTSEALATEVAAALPSLIAETPEPRRGFLESVFSGLGGILLADSEAQGIEIVNEFAPEHLQIRTADPWATMQAVRNAGEILLGPHSAFSLANYATGANAVLPTGGFARTWSGVSVHDFVKRSSVVHVSESALPEIGPHVQALAEYEGFYWHARAIRDRN